MPFVSRDQILAALAAGRHQSWNFNKFNVVPEAAGHWADAWRGGGSPGTGGVPGGSWVNMTNAAGSVNFSDVSPAKRYLWRVDVVSAQNGTVMVYDRLGQIGNISLTSTGNKTVNSAALPRSMDAADLLNVEAWLVVENQTATTAPVVSMNSYTNEAGVSGRSGDSLALPATVTNLGWVGKLPLQTGDKAVRAINTIEVSTAASAGTANVLLVRPLAYVPVVANVVTSVELSELPRVYDGSSLMLSLFATSAVAMNLYGRLVTVYDS